MAARRDIVVFTVAPDGVSEPTWPRLAALLDAGERARAAGFVFERNRREHVAAHALKRLMLTAAAGAMPPPAWRFETTPGGKPRVAGRGGLHFNLSHCDGLVACAVGLETEVGVDVEALGGEAPLELAPELFADEERRWLAALPAAQQRAGFFTLWTLKEAFIKATGRGLVQPLRDICFGFDPVSVAFRDAALGEPRAWRFEQRRIADKHLLALAWCGGEARVVIGSVRLEALLERVAAGVVGFDGLLQGQASTSS